MVRSDLYVQRAQRAVVLICRSNSKRSVKEIILMPRCGGAEAVMAVAFPHPSSLLSDPIIDDASALCQIPA